jgi:CBS domain-containing protein
MAASLRKFRIGAFPVVDDDGMVIGVISGADLLAKEAVDLARDAAKARYAQMAEMIPGKTVRTELQKADVLTAGDLMTYPAVTVRRMNRWSMPSD